MRLPKRISYFVRCANAVWHFDGNHKLSRWGFVTHRCVEGYSRFVMWMEVRTDNYASTVLGNLTPIPGHYLQALTPVSRLLPKHCTTIWLWPAAR